MLPLDLTRIGGDFYAGNCHKWLLAPTGSGFLAIGPGSEDRLVPLQVSWGWHYDRTRADEPDEFGSTGRLRALEFEGTRDPCSWLAVPAAIDFQEEIGWDAVRARIGELTAYVRRRLASVDGLIKATPGGSELHGAMTAFELPPTTKPTTLRKGLWDRRMEVPVIERPDRLLIRVSTHFYNTEAEVDRLAEGLVELLR
jgi:isopenicillin-N epimerase